MSNDNNENLSQNDNKDDFDELVNKIANLADSGTHTDQAEADAVLASEEDNEPENLDSPDSEDDGFEGANLVTLFDDDGNEYEFELLDYVDYEDKLYQVFAS